MTVGTREYAALASDAYTDRSFDTGKPKVSINDQDYKVLAVANRPSGYQGTAYQCKETGEVIIAHRGTESFKDGITDIGMAFKGRNNQLDDSIAFAEQAIKLAHSTQSNYPNPVTISTTGHSLGGSLAELTAARFGLRAETFNAYGPTELKDLHRYGIDVNAKHPHIVNHVRATDVVGADGHHFGEVHTYATPKDVESLRKGRYLDEPGLLRLPTNPLLTAGLSAHSMSTFLPDNPGGSIMTPENEARARAYQGPIAQYRRDVVNNRIDLATIAHRAPSPLNMINPIDPSAKLRLQAMDAGLVAATDMAVDGAQRVGRAAAEGFKAAGEGVSRAYDSVFGSKTATLPPQPQLDQPGHHDHAMFKQAQAGVHKLDAERGRTPDTSSNHLAAALVVAARRDGLTRIDSVALSDDASKAFALQGAPRSPAMKVASVLTVDAINTPISQSTQGLEEARQQNRTQVYPALDTRSQQVQRSPEPAMGM
ncbi:MAG: hypothetical protein J7605_10235 [Variovorax sp.]|nr:hypothetical protein [Variovorax sp.]